MAAQFARPYHHARSNGPSQNAPNAALLIDFDNVTMGIRSDLSKELKNLLNSDIIKGKVAVQRAYADWRRYPQYVVHLAEASVDLIFAPAYGSAKKNATDIRLAIDALELVFTRPEIGTFILLSGDSDFSSLVLKLKEYGKYVIGVGIRESASDILVQNCDEYYSYSSLSGLTKETDEERDRLDPWELVEKAVRQMASRRDVMRSDRLKQVMLELDGNFNEKELGYSKFSRFLADAAARNRLRLRKGENGQWEVAPPDSAPSADVPAVEARPAREELQSQREEPRGRRGRGRDHDRGAAERAPREPREERVAAVPAASPAAAVEPVAPAAVVEDVPSRVEAAEPAQRASAEPQEAGDAANDLRAAYDLLRRAVEYLVGKNGEMVRDSDVKRRMLELQPGWDESKLGFSKFSRFLRQAHDAEVIDLHRGEGGSYQLTLSTSRSRKHVELSRPAGRGTDKPSGKRQAAEQPEVPPARAEDDAPATSHEAVAPEAVAPRGRSDKASRRADKSAARAEKPEPAAPVAAEAEQPQPSAEAAAVEEAQPAAEKKEEPAVAAAATPVQPAPAARPATVTPRGIGIGRLGARGRMMQASPPPVLPGQAVVIPGLTATKSKAAEEATPAPAAATSSPATAPVVEPVPAAQAESSAQPVAPAQTITARYGLPTEAKEVEAYILGRYKGVGPKTVSALIEAFGASDLFGALESQPDRVREVLGSARRADAVLAAWKADLEQRRAAEVVAEAPAVAEAVAEPEAAESVEAPAAKPRASRRGGRRGAKRPEAAAAAESQPARRGNRGRTPKGAANAAAGAADDAAAPKAGKSAQRRGRRGSRPKATAGE